MNGGVGLGDEPAASIDLSTEELQYLASILDLTSNTVASTRSPGTELSLMSSIVRRGLIARRLITLGSDGAESVVEPVGWIVRLASAPGLVTTALSERAGVLEFRTFLAIPDASLEQVKLENDIFRFTPFETPEYPARLMGFVELHERPEVSDATTFRSSRADLSRCLETLSPSDLDRPIGVLTKTGVPIATAESFVRALATKVSSAQLTIIHRNAAGNLEGVELSWIDGGEGGLWSTSSPDVLGFRGHHEEDSAAVAYHTDEEDERPVVITPTTAKAIAREIFNALPGL